MINLFLYIYLGNYRGYMVTIIGGNRIKLLVVKTKYIGIPITYTYL